MELFVLYTIICFIYLCMEVKLILETEYNITGIKAPIV